MSKNQNEIVFTKERRVFFSKQSLNQELFQSQKEANSKEGEKTQIIKSTPNIQKPVRAKLKDEVEIKFNPKKFTLINPSARFEFRRAKVQFKLKNFFLESGQILVMFIDKGYEKDPDFIQLAELCQFDISSYVAQQKLGVGKVFPIIAKNYDNFEGVFLAYTDDHMNRLTLAEVVKNIFEQVEQNDIESIVIPMAKGYKNQQELSNIYIEETVNFLIRTKKPPQQITITADTNDKYRHLWKLYSEMITKIGDYDNLCLNRGGFTK